MSTIDQLSSHQYYRGLNRRTENRIKLLVRAGFRWDAERCGFVRPFPLRRNSTWAIPVCFLAHCHRRHFFETIRAQR